MRTRTAETPKSGASKKTPPPKTAAAAANKTPENAPKVKTTKTAVKQSTPKSTPAPKPESKEETAAPTEAKKHDLPAKSAAMKPGVKGKSPMSGKATPTASNSEETKTEISSEDPEPKVKEESKVQDVKDELESDPAKDEESAMEEEPMEEEEDEEPMDEDEQEIVEELGDEELANEGEEGGEGVKVDEGEKVEEEDGAQVEEEEQIEILDMAKARKIKKEQEIFIGGLDRDAVEEDLRKAFEKVGEVAEVRLHRDFTTNKNKGYAFVKFAYKEQAAKALAEMKYPVIRGKRCGIAPSEDNDTLFVGNICNTWTKEAVRRKLKDYGIDNVENITLVPDTQNEGFSRGFAFMEFSCHADAMLAYKRLQKPDAVFGHPERTVKVAFADPLREPDPEIMAQVKSVFVDGLPPYWDEDRVKEQFKRYGEIDRVVLARNMSSAKRNDFGFVNFTTHEAAVACVEGVNNTELGDGKSKMKARARLANPLPKNHAVKGGMSGGFRIGHFGSGVYSRFGRGFGRGRYLPNRAGFQGGRGFHLRGRGRGGRFPFAADNVENTYSNFRGRSPYGARGGGRVSARRGAFDTRGGRVTARRGAFDTGRGRTFTPRRQPIAPEEDFGRPVDARYLERDPYFYDDCGLGIKRPFSMMDDDSGYLESGSRLRSRYDLADIAPGRYRGSLGMTGTYSHDYYGSDYGGSGYSSLYGGEQSSGGYYY